MIVSSVALFLVAAPVSEFPRPDRPIPVAAETNGTVEAPTNGLMLAADQTNPFAPPGGDTSVRQTDGAVPLPTPDGVQQQAQDNVPSADQDAAQTTTSEPAPSSDTDGDIVVTGRVPNGSDPVEVVNAQSYAATLALDGALLRPVAMAYESVLPKPVRSGLRNVLFNLREPVVFVNFLLQHKIGKAAETVGRFVVNSTVGALGLIDVAKGKGIRLPRRANGFADTLGFYGIGPGPYLYLPLIGPTTVRDLIGETADRLLLPTAIGTPFNKSAVTLPLNVIGILDRRSAEDEQLCILRKQSADPYLASRTFYLERRQNEIDHLRGTTKLSPPQPLVDTVATANPDACGSLKAD